MPNQMLRMWWRRTECRCTGEWLRSVRAVSTECSVGWIGSAKAGIVRVIGVNVRRSSITRDRHRKRRLDRNLVRGEIHRAPAAQGDIGDEVDGAVTAAGVKFQNRVGANCS